MKWKMRSITISISSMELPNVSNISSTPNLHHNQVSRQSQTLFPVIIDSVPKPWSLTMRSGLNALGRAMGTEVDEQNQHIDRIINKTDKVSFNFCICYGQGMLVANYMCEGGRPNRYEPRSS
jgi:hypothetical protein